MFSVRYELHCAEPQVGDMQLSFRTLLEVQYLRAISHKRRDITRLAISSKRKLGYTLKRAMGNMEVVIERPIYVLNGDLTSSLKLRTRKRTIRAAVKLLIGKYSIRISTWLSAILAGSSKMNIV
jgi:hypothetical protein